MTTFPRLALYIFFFSIHENIIIDWARIISSELSFSLEISEEIKGFTCPHT
jgi:hypothetical protein